MPRLPRVDLGDHLYHVINRANARLPIFFDVDDYFVFENILKEASEKYDMRILAYCLMPNHFHLVLYPKKENDLQKFMQWITLTHTQRWHQKNKTVGTGHLYQGRYKSFLIQGDIHLITVIRYVERNPLRANLVRRAEDWQFSSLFKRLNFNVKTNFLSAWPILEPKNYIEFVNAPANEKEEEAIRCSVNRSRPFGSDNWCIKTITEHKLEGTVRNRGRQIKGA